VTAGTPPEDEGAPPGPRKREAGAKAHYSGHRTRLRERFLANPDTLPDYELLELLLFQAHPRGDVKPLAKALLAEFKTFAGVITAAPEALVRVDGAALKTAEASALRLLKGQVMNQPVLGSWDRILDYCHAAMDHRATEQFRILFLDNRNRLIADEVQQKGTVNHAPVYPREVARRALELHASAVIMVHNHPSGDPTPSAGDQDMTLAVRDALRAVGIGLHDHLVISKGGHISFRSQGLF
jgi:DNA repair protein RadC